MYPVPGHVAVAALAPRYLKVEWIPVIIGVMIPDLVDKPLNDVFSLTPHGRCAMHSLLGLCLATLIVYLIWGRTKAYSYGVGHFSHLLGDLDFVPWFWPFIEYDWPDGINVLDATSSPLKIFIPWWIFLETVLLVLALFLYTRYAKKRSIQAAILTAFILVTIYRLTREKPEGMAAPGR